MTLIRTILCGLALGYFMKGGSALKCYECINSKVESIGLLGSFWDFEKESDPECEYAAMPTAFGLHTKTCTSGQVCGVAKGSVSYGFVKSSTVARSCMVEPSLSDDGCVKGLSEAAQILSIFMSSGFGFDGDVCFCSSDFCSAGPCGDDMVKIFGYCVTYWALAVAIAIIVLLPFVLTCCCCCCYCCRSTTTPGIIVSRGGPLHTTVF